MGELENRIQQDIITSMKAKDALKTETLRMAKSALTNAAIAKGKNELGDDEVLSILQTQIKQRKESLEKFTQAGRQELAAKEQNEMDILLKYLPEQLSEEKIEALVKDAIEQSQAKSKAEIGKVMKVLMPQIKGRADGKLVNQIVLKCLGS